MAVEPDGVDLPRAAGRREGRVRRLDRQLVPARSTSSTRPTARCTCSTCTARRSSTPGRSPTTSSSQLDLRSGEDRGRIYRLGPDGFQPPAAAPAGHGHDRRAGRAARAPQRLAPRHRPAAALSSGRTRPRSRRCGSCAATAKDAAGAAARPVDARRPGAPGRTDDSARAWPTPRPASASTPSGWPSGWPSPAARARPSRRWLGCADDADLRVRFQAGLHARRHGGRPPVADAWRRIARRDAADPWVRDGRAQLVGEPGPGTLRAFCAGPATSPRRRRPRVAAQLGARRRARAGPTSSPRSSAAALQLDRSARRGIARRRPGRRPAAPAATTSAPSRSPASRWPRCSTRRPSRRRRPMRRRPAVRAADAPAVLSLGQALRRRPGGRCPTCSTPGSRRRCSRPPSAALAGFDGPEVARRSCSSLEGGVRARASAPGDRGPLRPRAWIGALLDAIEAGQHCRAASDPAARRATLATTPTRRSDPAREPSSAATSRRPNRSEVIDRTTARPRSSPATPTRGRQCSIDNCPACHKAGELGHDVGPNLAGVRQPDGPRRSWSTSSTPTARSPRVRRVHRRTRRRPNRCPASSPRRPARASP